MPKAKTGALVVPSNLSRKITHLDTGDKGAYLFLSPDELKFLQLYMGNTVDAKYKKLYHASQTECRRQTEYANDWKERYAKLNARVGSLISELDAEQAKKARNKRRGG